MNKPLTIAAGQVFVMRTANQDVFVWPSVEWDLLYCHEELSELARAIQTINAPDHARNHDEAGLTLDERLHLEYGQVLMMVLTTGLALKLDPDRALDMALRKVAATVQRKRAAAVKET